MPELRWRHDGVRLIVPAVILPPLGSDNQSTATFVRALLDTGATTSGVVEKVATELALPGLGKRPVQTAAGLVQVERYAFRLGLFTGRFEQIEQAPQAFPHVLPLKLFGIAVTSNGLFDAIIGMDVLGVSDLRIGADGDSVLSFNT